MFVSINESNKLHYKILGAGETIVLCAGGFCNLNVWNEIAKLLSQYFQVIYYDHRGIGESYAPTENYTVELLSKDLLTLVDMLGESKVHLVGHSMGGFISQYFAAYYPDRLFSLTLCSSLLCMTPIGMQYLCNVETELIKDPESAMKLLYEIDIATQDPQVLLQQIVLCKEYDGRDYIHKISVPTQIISGKNEDVVTQEESQKLANSIKNVKSINFLDSGHMLQKDCPKTLADKITDFVKHKRFSIDKTI